MRQTRSVPHTSSHQRDQLSTDIQRAGYYPDIVTDILVAALADEGVTSHLVHAETIFDHAQVRRHVTVLVLTPTRLVVAHVDDLPPEHPEQPSTAAATTEAIALHQIRSVGVTHGIADPANYSPGNSVMDLTVAVSWGAVHRMELEPASCGDPNCDADHGYSGATVPDDLVVRISAAAEGDQAVGNALQFANALSAATTHL